MTKTLDFVILSTGLSTLKEIRSALAADSRARLLAGGDDIDQVYSEIERFHPAAAIVTIDKNIEPAMAFIARIAAEHPATAVICASRDASPDLIIRSLRAGAREFLRLPLTAEEFTTVLNRISEAHAEKPEAPKKRGRTVAVFSSKGGCGTSFLATNIAAALNAPTILVDLNLQAGDLSLFLGAHPKYSIADLIENRGRIDDSLMASYLTPCATLPHLSLLAAPPEADSADDIEPEHVFEVLEILRERSDYVVIDPQHTFDAITLAALDQADDILMIITLDIPTIRSAQRSLAIFDRLGYPRKKVRIIVNRWSKQIELDIKQVEKYLGEEVAGTVHSDYRTAVNSINLGVPLVKSEPSSKMAAEIFRITSLISGKSEAPAVVAPRRNILSLLRRQSGGKSERSQFGLNDA